MYLQRKIEKLETKSELCYFVGYSKGTNGQLFYSPREQIVLVSTNTIFLEDNYMIDRKPNDRFDLRELSDTPKESLKKILIQWRMFQKLLHHYFQMYERHVVVGGLSGHLTNSCSYKRLSLMNLIWILVATTRIFFTKIQEIGKVL